MKIDQTQMDINGLAVEVVRKGIRNMRLTVYPPQGRVRVAAPWRVNDEAVRQAVISRWPWIRRQQEKILALEREPAREYVTGEDHHFLGRSYRLNVIQKNVSARVQLLDGQVLGLVVRPGSSAAQRHQVLLAWYRKELKTLIPPLIAKWEPRLGVKVAAWGVKQMKTRWGTCNPRARRIWLNLELAKKPVSCLEYILVHEMAHLLERLHNRRFKAILDQALPEWRSEKARLSQCVLG